MESAAHAILLLTTLLLGDPGPAARDQARDHAKQATIAYNLGNFEEAAGHYENAYRLVQDSALLFNIGQAYRLAGKHDKALAAYKGFLRTSRPEDPNRAIVESRIADVEKALAESRKAAAPALTPSSPAGGAPQAESGAPTPAAPAPPHTDKPVGMPTRAPSLSWTNTTVHQAPPPITPESTTRVRTTAGGRIGWGGRNGETAASYHAFARLADPAQRVYELGFVKRPLYSINPTYQYSAVYGRFKTAAGWHVELGGLGTQDEWHMGGGHQTEYWAAAFRLERLRASDLCAVADEAILYAVPEASINVPVSTNFQVRGSGSYRQRVVSGDCRFHPALVTFVLSADVTLPPHWRVSTGVGHYAIFDLGPGSPSGPWPSRSSAAEQINLDARYVVGKITLVGAYRFITYAGGTNELTLGIEFRSRPDAP